MGNTNIHDLIIIGAGPAGYTAAIYAARADLKPLIFAGKEPGGQLTTTTMVENFPGFPEGVQGPVLMADMQKQATKFGAEIKIEEITKVDLSGKTKKIWSKNSEYEARAIIIATGARARTLGLKREGELWGKGIHTCATCDGFFYRGKQIMVIGGGDSAMEESNFLTKFADKVYLAHRKDSFRASEIMQEKVKNNPKIQIIWNSDVIEYLGEDKLQGVKIKNNQNNKEQNLKVDGLFFAIGHIPNTEIFREQLDIHKTGYINAKDNVYTNIEGVFVAGDAVDFTYRQAISAAGFGCMAAMAGERWLNHK